MEDFNLSPSDNSKERDDDREDIIEDNLYSNNLYKYETQKKEEKAMFMKKCAILHSLIRPLCTRR